MKDNRAHQEEFLTCLRAYMQRHPALRIGQAIMVFEAKVANYLNIDDIFYIDDYEKFINGCRHIAYHE